MAAPGGQITAFAVADAGEPAELWLKFTGRRIDTCKRVVHVSRIRKIEIGWVRVGGPAAWVSARHKPHRGG